MANDLTPHDPTGGSGIWDKIIEVVGELNLPKLLAGPAGEAISRLIAGGADIPAAWLQQQAQAIRDKTKAKSLISKTLADAAAELVKGDPALVRRAADAFIAREIRHQHNRETIAIKAIEELKDTPDAKTTSPDDDWLNLFARHAQEASSERMQALWAKILAGQLRNAQSFSLQTLRFVSELDEATASLFEKWSAYVVAGAYIPYPKKSGHEFAELMHLEDFGLITGVTGNLSNIISDDLIAESNGRIAPLLIQFRPHLIIIEIKKPFNANFPMVGLTRIGRELYPITKGQSTFQMVNEFAEVFPKQSVRSITLSAPGDGQRVLWAAPASPS